MDVPLTAEGKGSRSRDAYLRGFTIEKIQKERDEALDATPEDIRGLAEYVRAFMEDDCLCGVGSEEAVKAAADEFMKIENLF